MFEELRQRAAGTRSALINCNLLYSTLLVKSSGMRWWADLLNSARRLTRGAKRHTERGMAGWPGRHGPCKLDRFRSQSSPPHFTAAFISSCKECRVRGAFPGHDGSHWQQICRVPGCRSGWWWGPLRRRDWVPVSIAPSSTLLGGKGAAGPSSGPTEYVNARWMQSLHGFLHGIEWIMFHGYSHCFQKSSRGGRPNTIRGDYGTLNAHNRWFILFDHVWGSAWIEIHWNSIWLRVDHIWLHTTLEDPWPPYMILKVSRDGLWTLSFELS